VSPWIKTGSVDHSFQSTISAVKTIESLLNLPPMCQYDAASDCLGGWDTAASNDQPYAAILPSESLMISRNPSFANNADTGDGGPEQPRNRRPRTQPAAEAPLPGAAIELDSPAALAAVSDQMDFSKADQAPAELLNRVIWKTVRGVNSEAPPTPHGVTYGAPAPKDDDD